MKVVYKVLLIIILCFSFVGDIKAADPRYTSIYTNKYTKTSDQPNLMFAVYKKYSDELIASPMNTFTYQDETQGPENEWYTGGLKNQIKLIINGEAANIDLKYTAFHNKKYLHYDIKNGRNRFYLHNQQLDKNDIAYDMLFEKTPDYKESTPNAILDGMLCTYGPGEGQSIKSYYKFISIGMVREGSQIKYQVYFDFKPLFDEYKKIETDYNGYDGETYLKVGNTTINTDLIDHFSPRNFWVEETGVYGCPNEILMGYTGTVSSHGGGGNGGSLFTSTIYDEEVEIGWKEVMDKEYSNDTTGILSSEYSYEYDLVLYENSSYVDYTQGSENTQLCVFSKEVCDPTVKDCDDKWELSLKENYFLDGSSSYDLYHKTNGQFSDVYFKLSSGLINKDCNKLEAIYTNCLNGDRTHPYYEGYGNALAFIKLDKDTCIVSDAEFTGSEKYISNTYLNEFDKDTVEQSMGESNGFRYKQLICELKPMLGKLATQEELNKTTNLNIYTNRSEFEGSYNVSKLPCSTWGTESNFNCDSECQEDLDYLTNKKAREIFYYCNETYNGYFDKGYNNVLMDGRYEECKSFKTFYDSLTKNGILTDIFIGCEFISNELREKLEFVLDIIKIAGPILAITLGMWDFTKAVFAGDPDKEMQTAKKHFITRLIAAALLFLIPALLAIPLNIVLGDKVESSPFCNLENRSK